MVTPLVARWSGASTPTRRSGRLHQRRPGGVAATRERPLTQHHPPTTLDDPQPRDSARRWRPRRRVVVALAVVSAMLLVGGLVLGSAAQPDVRDRDAA